MKTLRNGWGRSSVSGAVLLAGFISTGEARAFVVNTTPQEFVFGPNALNFSQTASLATFNQPGTLLGVHIELSGELSFVLTATSGSSGGTVFSMSEQGAFSISGLPSASLSTMTPTYAVGSFALAPNSSQSFSGGVSAPVEEIDLATLIELAAYDVSAGAPASIDFQFIAEETFEFHKSGSGLAGSSEAEAGGRVKVWYTYDNLQPPPPVPEVSTSVSALLFGALASAGAFRARRRSEQAPQTQPL